MEEASTILLKSQSADAVSDSAGEDSSKSEVVPLHLPLDKRICLVGSVVDDPTSCRAAQSFGFPILTSVTGADYAEDTTCLTVFVTDTFEGPQYDFIHRSKHRILGPTALQQLSERNEPLKAHGRPLYSLSMSGVVVCFTGFRKKEELTRLIMLIHNMGGSIRKDMVSKVTHLIANSVGGDKYQYAQIFHIPVMSSTWVEHCWDNRNDPALDAVNPEVMMAHKLKPFAGARVCFLGFPADEHDHMAEILIENGGTVVDIDHPQCTHAVIDESTTSTLPEPLAPNTHIVKAEWFWTSVQNMGCADVKDYLFEDYLEGLQSPSRKESRATPGGSSNRLRKRKRLQETLNALAQGDTTVIHKRRSSVSDAGLLSVSGSFLDCTATPDKNILEELEPGKNLSPRQHVFLELVQTESNYVNILNTIMTMFKDPLEKMTEVGDGQSSEPLLNNTELKIIFGNLPPIYEIHQRMLEELRWSSSHWTEETSIGSIVLKYSNDLVKAYPPFVNFFENMKDMLVQCDQNKPRFHAFLKICQTKPECGRQSLQELLIRPVQRLPSISLLLNDILKHTSKNNPDHSALEKALEAIKEVMTNINEDKRRTEAQLVMFDIFNEIDNCPPHLVSSHRSFISRCEVMELSEGLSGRGNHLMMFLFSDILEVCKKRSKASNVKSPTSLNGLHHSNKLSSVKPYKHIKLFPLSHIKRVVDIQETIDYQKVFAIMCRSNQELKEKLYSFQIMDMDVDKNTFLRTLCRQMANTVCKADADTFLACLKSQDLEIDTSDINVGTLSKAFKFASRTRMKVGRAFSFNKTPSKLKRAVSTMMSPFGSTTNLTPASHLAQMRLASCTNINEIGTGSDSPNSEVLVAPMSVQPTRKAKCSSLSVGALRRL